MPMERFSKQRSNADWPTPSKTESDVGVHVSGNQIVYLIPDLPDPVDVVDVSRKPAAVPQIAEESVAIRAK